MAGCGDGRGCGGPGGGSRHMASASTTSVGAQSASAHSMVAASASTDTHVMKAAGPFHLTTPYGTVTYGWGSLASAPADVIPDSAGGCNQDVVSR